MNTIVPYFSKFIAGPLTAKGHGPSRLTSGYTKLQQMVTAPDTKVVVSLSGGGLRFVCHIPFFNIMERLNLVDHIDEIWGTSAGAIAGGMYSCVKNSAEIIDFINSNVNLGAYQLNYWNPFKNPTPPFLSLDNMGIFKIEGTENVGRKFLNGRMKPQIPFFGLSYMFDFYGNTGKGERVTLSPSKEFDVADIMAASSAIPFVFTPKIKHGRLYYDGGVYENLPMQKIFDKWAQDRKDGTEERDKLLILAINLGYNKPSIIKQGLLTFPTAMEFFMDLVLNEKTREGLKNASTYKNTRVLLLDPQVWNMGLLEPWKKNHSMNTSEKMLLHQLSDQKIKKLPRKWDGSMSYLYSD